MKNSYKITFIVTLFCFSNCTNGLQKDTQRIIISHKNFFKSLAFSGVINEKKYCEKCEFNKYQVIIKLKKTDPEVITLSDKSFQPYYFFSAKTELNISVTQNLYESVKEGTFVEKKRGSNALISESQEYTLLNNKKFQWLPD